MIPLAEHIPDGKTLRKGLLSGNVVLLLIAMSMISAMLVCPEAGQDELPMIVLAGEISPVLQTGYSVLMTLSMVVSALGACLRFCGSGSCKRRSFKKERDL